MIFLFSVFCVYTEGPKGYLAQCNPVIDCPKRADFVLHPKMIDPSQGSEVSELADPPAQTFFDVQTSNLMCVQCCFRALYLTIFGNKSRKFDVRCTFENQEKGLVRLHCSREL